MQLPRLGAVNRTRFAHRRLNRAVLEALEQRAYLTSGQLAFFPANQVLNSDAPTAVTSGQFVTGSSNLNLAVANQAANTVQVLIGNGSGGFAAPVTYSVPNGPSSIIAADLGNGQTDLVVLSSQADDLSVLLGNGNGTFSAPIITPIPIGVSNAAGALAVADLNGDGHPDVAIANSAYGSVEVLLSNGNGTFQSPQSLVLASAENSPSASALAIGDLAGGTSPDIGVADNANNLVDIFINNGDGTFQAPETYLTGSDPTSVAIGDINGDGHLDLVTANYGANTVTLLLGNGNGTFAAPNNLAVGNGPLTVASANVIDGSASDIVTTNPSDGQINVLAGNIDGNFGAAQSFAAGAGPTDVAIGDFTGDGKPDLVIADPADNALHLLISNGSGFKSPATISIGDHPDAVANGQFTASSTQDAVVVDYFTSTAEILVGDGKGDFTLKGSYSVANGPTAVLTSDLGNGQTDIIVASAASGDITVLLGNGDGTFAPAIITPVPAGISDGTTPIAISTLNTGDHPDLVIAGGASGKITVLLGNGDGHFTSPATYPLLAANGQSANASNVAIADFNGDGKPDVVASDSAQGKLDLLLNNGSGGFDTATTTSLANGPATLPLAVGLFNGDNHEDIATGFGTSVDVLLGNGNGTFSVSAIYSNGAGTSNLTAVDLNGDGDTDLIVSHYSTTAATHLSILLGNGNGTFAAPSPLAVNAPVSSVVAVDVNSDNIPDLLAVSPGFNALDVILNGSNTVQFGAPSATSSANASAIAAATNDGSTEIVVADAAGDSISVFLANADGSLNSPHTYSIGGVASALLLADVNGDGNLDIIAASASSGQVFVLLSNGDGTFKPAIATTVPKGVASGLQSIAVADVNGDHHADLAVADGVSGYISLLLGNDDGHFQAPRLYSLGDLAQNHNAHAAVDLEDLNGDGRPDLVALSYTASSSEVYVLLNTGNSAALFDAAQPVLTNNLSGNYAANSVAVSDFNGDGQMDIVVLDAGGQGSILLGNGNGTFLPATTFNAFLGQKVYSLYTTDVNFDAKLDLFAATNNGELVAVGDGNGDFASAQVALAQSKTSAGVALKFQDTGETYNVAVVSQTYGTVSVALNSLGGVEPVSGTPTVPPLFISANSTTFTVGSSASFTFTVTGSPTITILESGALPSGLTFVDNGNGTASLSGTPAASTGGRHVISITSENSKGARVQTFTLKVDAPPAIISADEFTFDVASPGTFSVATHGFPSPTITETGALPDGLSFHDNRNGTATISGTPAATAQSEFTFTLTATNTVSSAQQTFTLDLNGAGTAPAITSADAVTFMQGNTVSFTVTADGSPTPSLMESGALPPGLSFADNGNGTATLGGDPTATGVYTLTFSATNGIQPSAAQTFTLTVVPAPSVQLNSGGTLSIVGSTINNTLTVSVTGGDLVVEIDGHTNSYSLSSVNLLDVTMGDGNDTVTLESATVPPANISVLDDDDLVVANNHFPDTIGGGLGNDTIIAFGQNSSLSGGQGNDFIAANGIGSTAGGGLGDDTIQGGGGDVLNGGQGNDFFLDAGADGDTLNGGTGVNFNQRNPTDTVTNSLVLDPPKHSASAGPAVFAPTPAQSSGATAVVENGVLTITGTSGADSISVTPNVAGLNFKVFDNGTSLGAFAIASLNGVAIAGGPGADTITLDPSVTLPALIKGGGGNDSLSAGGGDNTLVGAGGSDTLVGGSGVTDLVPDAYQAYGTATGTDSLVGGSGLNIADFRYRTDNLDLSNNGTLTGGEIISSNVSEILGGTGNDTIIGATGGEVLSGGAGADSIHGGGVNDFLIGGNGQDSVIVAAEPVTLYMKDGFADTVNGVSNASQDIITDDVGVDSIP